MLTLLLIFIAAFIFIFIIEYESKKSFINILICSFIISLLITPFVGIPFTMLITTKVLKTSEEKIVFEQFKIVSVNNDKNINGSFVLGNGTINSTEYYYMMAKIDENKYIRYKANSNDSVIVESLESPHVICYINKIPEKFEWWLFDKIDFRSYEIKVPPDTIIKEFNLQ